MLFLHNASCKAKLNERLLGYTWMTPKRSYRWITIFKNSKFYRSWKKKTLKSQGTCKNLTHHFEKLMKNDSARYAVKGLDTKPYYSYSWRKTSGNLRTQNCTTTCYREAIRLWKTQWYFSWYITKAEIMRTTTPQRLSELQKNPKNIRNICILAHVDHGEWAQFKYLLRW